MLHSCFGVFFTRSSDVWCLLQVLCDVDSKESWRRRGGNNNLLHPCSFDVDRGASLVLLFSLFFFFFFHEIIYQLLSFVFTEQQVVVSVHKSARLLIFSEKKKKRTTISVCGVADFSGRVAHVMMGISYCLELPSWMYSVHRKQLSTHAVVGGGFYCVQDWMGEGGCQSELCVFFLWRRPIATCRVCYSSPVFCNQLERSL